MMELPTGTPIKEGMNTNRVDFRKLFPTLREHLLTGYMSVDLMTNSGMEEGVLLYNKGEIIAADYTYISIEKTLVGEDALKLVMNAMAGDGVFDVYEVPEGELIKARENNREGVLKYKPTDEEIMGMVPDTFTEVPPKEEKKVIKTEVVKTLGGISKDEVLKKYGISRPDDRMVDTLLKDLH